MRKILITGSNGFIGQEIVNQLLNTEGEELIAVSRGKNRVEHEKDFIYRSADVCDQEALAQIIAEYKPDSVIHTVAMANVDRCEEDAAECNHINVQPVKHLTRLAEQHNFHLIYLSTDFVFDGLNGPYKEEDETCPLNHYGVSKVEAERYIQQSSCVWSIVRTILVYGAPYDRSRSNLILWVKSSLENKKNISVVTDHYRMPTFVGDLAKACLEIARREARGIYHISSDEIFSVYEIAQQVADFWNLDKSLITPVKSTDLPSKVARPSYTGFNIDKARNDLDFSPTSLISGLEKIDQIL